MNNTRLTGNRCPKCGACCYKNESGDMWCSACSFYVPQMFVRHYEFNYVAVPDDHPHIELLGARVEEGEN